MPCVLESLSCEITLAQSFFNGTIFAGMAASTIQKYNTLKIFTLTLISKIMKVLTTTTTTTSLYDIPLFYYLLLILFDFR